MTRFSLSNPNRRTVLKGAVAGTAVLAAPSLVWGQTAPFVRKNLKDVADPVLGPAVQRDLDSYRRGVGAMLALPPDHPHNWYRNAVIHLMDCPHGNWWFTVWHRGYLGYFEQIVRKLSGDDEFALPFWDWTAEPRIPEGFFSNPASSDPMIADNPLDPTSSHYPADFASFEADYKEPFRAMFNGFDAAQRAQLNLRLSTQNNAPGAVMDFDTFWDGWWNSVQQNFNTPRNTARSKTLAAPDLTGSGASNVVESIIDAAIDAPEFVLVAASGTVDPSSGFNSVAMPNHHGMSRSQAVLELQPHNQVHNNIGGIMPTNLSSIDPIFFMHHSNVDRIWDIWSRKQINQGKSADPLPAQQAQYFGEEFLMFLDADGNPVTSDTSAGTFMHTDRYNYAYNSGTGEEKAGTLLAAATERFAAMPMAANALISSNSAGIAGLTVSNAFSRSLEQPRDQTRHVAHITFVPPADVAGVDFNVFISPRGVAPDTSAGSPELAATFGFFGMRMPGMADEPATVTVDITQALDRLRAQGTLAPGEEVDFSVTAAPDEAAVARSVGAPITGLLKSVSVEAI